MFGSLDADDSLSKLHRRSLQTGERHRRSGETLAGRPASISYILLWKEVKSQTHEARRPAEPFHVVFKPPVVLNPLHVAVAT